MDRIRTPRRSFLGGVAFAAAAALTLPFCVTLLAPLFGHASAQSLHLYAVAIGYIVWLAPSRQHALSGTAIGLVAIPLLSWAGASASPWGGGADLAWHALTCAVVVSLIRSLHYFRVSAARALGIELVLGVSGAFMVALLAGPSMVSQAAALWGFMLVQSVYALIPGARVRNASDGSADPFERATSRLRRLLDEA